MRYGFVMASGDARAAAELAALAEEHGWDGFFVWEAVWGIDADWSSMDPTTARAAAERRLKAGRPPRLD
ncbi:hypothetical protein OG558_29485 [Kribbella sp. NBC_01510]|uniref:hypothetical protein n=1 Tax=Kribbella sp. NBC_01510 TaxID=2903581 RepID=UPI003865BB4F